ncbi:L,D-transpeptidase family protein [Clostridium tertium]|uniref:L,D-transpeptidase family protein n=1 Tax=Clostridium tertium TaxID=1559 RepID=UPI00232C0BBE|nr:L,D-transpeptidase family protein [Clostridium tertium]MDB1924148.1 L,D-transpeptidase family protein [Clostridium tertium]MDB1927347.1 L,D-transpeptidase family protein [Clostridium tertium]MDB1931123.1 L,D-transpeptidase family protein [Clostridium tertium]
MYNNKSKPQNKVSIFMILSSMILFILLGFGANIYLSSQYSKVTSSFYKAFNNCEFSDAKTNLNNKILSLKKKQLNSDLNDYFTDIVDKICISLSKNEITTNQALSVLNEIKSYNVLNSSLDKLISALDDKDSNSITSTTEGTSNKEISSANDNSNDISADKDNYLNLGISAFNSKDYSKAMKYFSLIPSSLANDYELAQEYIEKCKSNYKDYLLESADELVANKYYTKAIDFLSDYDSKLLSKNDITEIKNKISSIKLFREEYQGDDSEYTSNAILQSITLNNVNTLSISSKTNYFVYLNLAEQKTYVYEGETNDWDLVKEFSCSTGLPGKETPKGIFAVTNRGEWFFSDEFDQGGKYWVQFMGDYLFHSVPFDETQTVILDDTLGTPASHGCIRLKVEDAKWLYDNIANDTKIIIN